MDIWSVFCLLYYFFFFLPTKTIADDDDALMISIRWKQKCTWNKKKKKRRGKSDLALPRDRLLFLFFFFFLVIGVALSLSYSLRRLILFTSLILTLYTLKSSLSLSLRLFLTFSFVVCFLLLLFPTVSPHQLGACIHSSCIIASYLHAVCASIHLKRWNHTHTHAHTPCFIRSLNEWIVAIISSHVYMYVCDRGSESTRFSQMSSLLRRFCFLFSHSRPHSDRQTDRQRNIKKLLLKH